MWGRIPSYSRIDPFEALLAGRARCRPRAFERPLAAVLVERIDMGAPEFSNVEGIQARLDEQLAQAQQNLQRAEAFAQQALALQARARSEHGEVSVEVDSAGVPSDIEITSAAFTLTPQALSELVLAVTHQAHRDVTQKYETLVHSAFGESATAQELVEQARQRLGNHAQPTDSQARIPEN